jgi:hypothetical protein
MRSRCRAAATHGLAFQRHVDGRIENGHRAQPRLINNSVGVTDGDAPPASFIRPTQRANPPRFSRRPDAAAGTALGRRVR